MSKKSDFLEVCRAAMETKQIEKISLNIHMPGGETETIVNPNVEQKLNYIEQTYDDDLVHKNNKDIYITDYKLIEGKNLISFGTAISLMVDSGYKMGRKRWDDGTYIYCVPEQHDRKPYIAIHNSDGTVLPWRDVSSDALGDDYYFFK